MGGVWLVVVTLVVLVGGWCRGGCWMVGLGNRVPPLQGVVPKHLDLDRCVMLVVDRSVCVETNFILARNRV